MTALLLALALGSSAHQYSTDEAQKMFAAANDAFLKGQLAESSEGYRSLIADGYDAADVHYNLGNSLLAADHPGQAILEYERARRLDPSDEDITSNLDRARRDLVDKVSGPNESPLVERIALLLSPNLAGGGLLAAYLLFWVALALRRLGRLTALTPPAAVLAVLVALPLTGVVGAQIYQRSRLHAAVVVAPSDSIHEGPSASSKVSFEVHEGTELRVLQREGNYARVRLYNGLEGWASAKAIEEI